MNNLCGADKEVWSKQLTIRDKCRHPSGTFVEFEEKELEQSITERFELQVAKYGERIAVTAKDLTLTYNALNELANTLAHAVLARCREKGKTVGLLFGQSGTAIAAVLGVLKAGKIYVPLDPAYPGAGLTSILEDSEAALIFTDSANLLLAQSLAAGRCPLLNIDELNASLSNKNLGLPSSPDDIVSIFYTSGSTGQPKGVTQSNRNVLHRAMTDINNFHLCPEDRLSLLSAPTYGGSLRSFFGALLSGATLCPYNVGQEGLVRLAEWLIREKITIYFSVPTVFRHFAETLDEPNYFAPLRVICMSGEPVAKRDVELYRKHFSSDCVLVNSFASNEAGIIRQHFIDKETQIDGNVVPAGYKIDGKEIVLLTESGEKARFNEVGEIIVKSRHLSPGYWRKPDLTNTAFLPEPEGGDCRIYVSGDLGQMLPDGSLVHLGRKDNRVKIHGIGIELTDIEMALLKHAAVKEVVVIARDDFREEKELVAYIVPQPGEKLDLRELRTALKQELPSYMAPAAFVILDGLPLTPTGKVDRQALPPPDRMGLESEGTFVPPQTHLEKKLAEIWGGVLGLEQVGIADNFFELGGHSLSATEVLSQVRGHFHVDLPMATLLTNPTVAEVAIAIAQLQAEQVELDETFTQLEHLSEEEARHLLTEQLPKG